MKQCCNLFIDVEKFRNLVYQKRKIMQKWLVMPETQTSASFKIKNFNEKNQKNQIFIILALSRQNALRMAGPISGT